jgi:putative glycosyltransferase (TIGR04372 family)
MWQRTIHIYAVAAWLDRLNRRVPGGKSHIIPIATPPFHNRDIHGLLARNPPHLSFTSREEHMGQDGLNMIGIPAGAPFVCLMARDSAYLDSLYPERDWSYHDHRDASIQNHIPSAEELTRRGYFVVRMGAAVKESLNTTNPMVIDYATNFRTDFLDMYLGSQCRFLLTTDCGYQNVAQVFRRPIAWTNYPYLEFVHTWLPNQLFIPKKLWHKAEQRFLTFPEILESRVGRIFGGSQFDQLGIELIENTPEDISAIALEMDDRLSGAWQSTEEDEDLQRRFWELFASSELHGRIVSRIGTEFLRQNRDLL